MNTREDIITVMVKTGETFAQSPPQSLNGGKIIGVAAFKSAANNNNPGIVRGAIKNGAGTYVSNAQPIDNYRSRDTANYENSGKPLQMNGGLASVEITADKPFTADTYFEFVFMYAADEQNCAV